MYGLDRVCYASLHCIELHCTSKPSQFLQSQSRSLPAVPQDSIPQKDPWIVWWKLVLNILDSQIQSNQQGVHCRMLEHRNKASQNEGAPNLQSIYDEGPLGRGTVQCTLYTVRETTFETLTSKKLNFIYFIGQKWLSWSQTTKGNFVHRF